MGKGTFEPWEVQLHLRPDFLFLPMHGLRIFVHRKCQFCTHFKIKLLLYLVFWQKCSFFRHMRDWVECSCSIVVSALILSVIGRLLNRISQQLGEFQKHKHMVRQDESWQDKMWVSWREGGRLPNQAVESTGGSYRKNTWWDKTKRDKCSDYSTRFVIWRDLKFFHMTDVEKFPISTFVLKSLSTHDRFYPHIPYVRNMTRLSSWRRELQKRNRWWDKTRAGKTRWYQADREITQPDCRVDWGSYRKRIIKQKGKPLQFNRMKQSSDLCTNKLGNPASSCNSVILLLYMDCLTGQSQGPNLKPHLIRS